MYIAYFEHCVYAYFRISYSKSTRPDITSGSFERNMEYRYKRAWIERYVDK